MLVHAGSGNWTYLQTSTVICRKMAQSVFLKQNDDRKDGSFLLYASLFSSPLPRSSMARDDLPRAHDTPQTIKYLNRLAFRASTRITTEKESYYMMLSEHCEPSPLYSLGCGVLKYVPTVEMR